MFASNHYQWKGSILWKKMHLFDQRKLFQSFTDGGASIVDRVPPSLQKLLNQNWSDDIDIMILSNSMNQNTS